jgi:hypothetical protein
MSFRVPEKFRIRTGPLASTAATGNAGAFDIRLPHSQRKINRQRGFMRCPC